jgi:hypothetical protein
MKRILIAVTALAAALAVTGCRGDTDKGDGVATAGGTPTSNASGNNSNAGADTGDMAEKMRKFASCMREHGIDMPDPEVDDQGRVKMQIGEGGQEGGAAPVDKDKFEAAQKECQQYLPNGGEPPKMDPADVEKMRQFAKCMRENGIPDFPDPQPDGGMRIEFGQGTGIDPNSQTFKDAQAKCEQYMPAPKGPGSRDGGTTSGGGS